jgi:ABC-type Fe3+ transport system substrate-binding protein
MPIGYLVKRGEENRVQPLVDYVNGAELGQMLSRNCYPPSRPQAIDAFPPGARLKWPGWDYVRQHDMAADTRLAAEVFFAAWYARHAVAEQRACS